MILQLSKYFGEKEKKYTCRIKNYNTVTLFEK